MTLTVAQSSRDYRARRKAKLERLAVLEGALANCEALESGPNGRGGMRVVAHFPNGGDETALFSFLNTELAARKALGDVG